MLPLWCVVGGFLLGMVFVIAVMRIAGYDIYKVADIDRLKSMSRGG